MSVLNGLGIVRRDLSDRPRRVVVDCISRAAELPARAFIMVNEEPMSTQPRRHFSKDLLIFVAGLMVVFGGVIVVFRRASHQHELVAQVQAAGGRVAHDWQWSDGTIVPERRAPWWTEFMARSPSGPEFLTRVVFVDLSGSQRPAA